MGNREPAAAVKSAVQNKETLCTINLKGSCEFTGMYKAFTHDQAKRIIFSDALCCIVSLSGESFKPSIMSRPCTCMAVVRLENAALEEAGGHTDLPATCSYTAQVTDVDIVSLFSEEFNKSWE